MRVIETFNENNSKANSEGQPVDTHHHDRDYPPQTSTTAGQPHSKKRTQPRVEEDRPVYASPYHSHNTKNKKFINPADYLRPEARLARYIKHYDKSLKTFYASHPQLQTNTNINHQRPPHLNGSVEEPVEPYTAAATVLRPTTRQEANIIYNITGDPRYRYRREYEDENYCDPHDVSQSRQFALQQYKSGKVCNVQRAGRIPVSHTNANHNNRLANQFRPPFDVSVNTNNNREGYTSSKSRCISLYAVDYLDPVGSTLPRRTDKVQRGEYMRELWERDAFLKRMEKGK
ncbi:hypothetical protein AGDE_14797 [Angomonas deanei]|uniref:Uncharacterized protein n=1 Tax=Angomonas deanei TaxID=59799 RepID=A0A7G2CP16_9TRYP|nr:hypothetical protein AGDE_14797 [Angomonas deanei]CAD2221235.1 hypothetical protein, conserved [Angomonas deanei]|eukprot:EPY20204.1 hypothetical protein AGDE_14797 [Angomonas deanei]